VHMCCMHAVTCTQVVQLEWTRCIRTACDTLLLTFADCSLSCKGSPTPTAGTNVLHKQCIGSLLSVGCMLVPWCDCFGHVCSEIHSCHSVPSSQHCDDGHLDTYFAVEEYQKWTLVFVSPDMQSHNEYNYSFIELP
jgi:hypothetical protein